MTGAVPGPPGTVEVAGLTVAWPSGDDPGTAVDGIDLAVEAGSIVSIVGPSGCGKSTLLRVLAGLLVPDAGTASVDGIDVAGAPGSCAWLPQRDNLLPWRRVLGNATLGAEVGGVPRAQAEAEARHLLSRFGLAGVEDAWPTELSGGMRQRVAVLRTFLTPAPVLLLDEPFGALDALTRRQMQAWLQEVWMAVDGSGTGAGGGARTVLLVTHDVEEALLLGDRVVVMSPRPGRFTADVPVTFARPRPPDLVAAPEFVALRSELLGLLGA
ncbi:ABC transporter ATP-binding protein [Aquihabitans sp. McL0605]|uniref:ABC transporter ATP-binding protein n=1 Tax=Aquihabitans sp. McL0605 TaxID=3415671 RepID=UPI003CEEA3CD